tara:strand:- start:57 stop:833 length:777 start_codon:yes stop_codon:yes gene_type:complete
MDKKQYLTLNTNLIKNKTVLDLACHSGLSTQIIHRLGAKHIYAVDIRPELIQKAQKNLDVDNVEFFTGDITDNQLISNLVSNSNTITCFGALYHLFDHFNFLSYILKPNIEYVLLETEFGSESLNPEMYWAFERTDSVLNGWYKNFKLMPHGTPNLSWILQSADLFGFKCDWIEFYGSKQKKSRYLVTAEEYLTIAGPSWPSYQELMSSNPVPDFVENEIAQFLHITTNKRMIIRLYNSNLITSTPLILKDIYQWQML